jgi:hypothetical protein
MAKQRKVSIVAAANKEAVAQAEVLRQATQDSKVRQSTTDSFINLAQRMGIGADNALTSSSYGYNPITRNRVMLEWIHRGSWIGGVAVDVVADDMTRAGVDFEGEIDAGDMQSMRESEVSLGLWNAINDGIKWSRLYGGAIVVMMIDGQDMKTPLRLDTVAKGQFKGLITLDRWMVEPSLNDLVTDMGPNIGMPKFYRCNSGAPAFQGKLIHFSRVIRLEGLKLPYWQRVTEQLWGLSVLERIYDRMVAFDSATTGAAQLVYKSYLRTLKVKDMREIVSSSGAAVDGLVKYVEMMRRFQGIEGISLIDAEDDISSEQHGAFSGLSDALTQFGQQLAGALQIPLVRLFGQSPSGFSTGDADMQNYYDGIYQKQEKELRVGVTNIYRCLAASEEVELPEGFRVKFNSLWEIDSEKKANIATSLTNAVIAVHTAGLISDQVALQELRQSSHETGIFTNITEELIEQASEDPVPPADLAMAEEGADDGNDGADSQP